MTWVGLYIHELDEDLLFVFSLSGILVRSTKGSRNQAQEMIENLHVLQHAKRHCMNRTINEDFAQFLSCNLIRSPNLDRPKNKRLILKTNAPKKTHMYVVCFLPQTFDSSKFYILMNYVYPSVLTHMVKHPTTPISCSAIMPSRSSDEFDQL
jgi:hypothetical protein